MAIDAMKKMSILGHKTIRMPVLDILQQLGAVHFKELEREGDSPDTADRGAVASEEVTEMLGELDYLIGFLSPFMVEEGLFKRLSSSKPKVTADNIRSHINDYKNQKTYDVVRSIAHSLSEDSKKIYDLKAELDMLAPWIEMDIPVEDLAGGRIVDASPLKIPADAYDSFLAAVKEELSDSDIYPVSDKDASKYVVFVSNREEKARLISILGRLGLEKVNFAGMSGTPAQIASSMSVKIKEIEAEQVRVKAKAAEYAKQVPEIKIIHDYYFNEKERVEAQRFLGDTRDTFFLEGWVRSKDADKIKKLLEDGFDGIYISLASPAKDDDPPIALKNRSLIAPFEGITKLYGMPNSGEADPTPFLAPFFFLFFGLCLTDAGYGLIIFLIALYVMFKFELSKDSKNMVKLVLFCGISTIVAGVVTGGWFGDLVLIVGNPTLISIQNSLMLFDPIKEPMTFFILAVVLGYIQVTFGVIIEVWDLMRHGNYKDAIFGQLPWVTFFFGLAMFLSQYVDAVKYAQLAIVGKWVWVGSLLFFLFFYGNAWGEKNILKRVGYGLLKIYGLVGYLSDILSYSRLLALGLATAAVANVINKIAVLSSNIPFVGYGVMVLILVGGHTYNLVLNCLAAAVHSLRLQFVEFFPKFFSGGGKMFSPFRSVDKYSVIIDGVSLQD
ncbi:MAG: V-type ATP synthase subunit I [Nitrospinota bacterium]|nr:V-type ATP synthase subunit I [Nitrospinota bacterium]